MDAHRRPRLRRGVQRLRDGRPRHPPRRHPQHGPRARPRRHGGDLGRPERFGRLRTPHPQCGRRERVGGGRLHARRQGVLWRQELRADERLPDARRAVHHPGGAGLRPREGEPHQRAVAGPDGHDGHGRQARLLLQHAERWNAGRAPQGHEHVSLSDQRLGRRLRDGDFQRHADGVLQGRDDGRRDVEGLHVRAGYADVHLRQRKRRRQRLRRPLPDGHDQGRAVLQPRADGRGAGAEPRGGRDPLLRPRAGGDGRAGGRLGREGAGRQPAVRHVPPGGRVHVHRARGGVARRHALRMLRLHP